MKVLRALYCPHLFGYSGGNEVGKGKRYEPTGRYKIFNKGAIQIEVKKKGWFTFPFWIAEGEVEFIEEEIFTCGEHE